MELKGPSDEDENISEAGLFRLFLTDSVVNLMVNEVNRYADQMKEKRGQDAHAQLRLNNWKPVTFDEMKAFITILF